MYELKAYIIRFKTYVVFNGYKVCLSTDLQLKKALSTRDIAANHREKEGHQHTGKILTEVVRQL